LLKYTLEQFAQIFVKEIEKRVAEIRCTFILGIGINF